MKSQIPTPVVIGIIAAIVLIGGFFMWRGASGSASYTPQEQAMDKETTKQTGQNLYGSPDASASGQQPMGGEAGARGGQ